MNTLSEIWARVGPETDIAYFTAEAMLKLVLAVFLGGIIGIERELHQKPAGLRTNMFICFGSALFTVLSFKLANLYPGDHTRIAAQIIPGIGFIGAGSILHERGSITGLTSAATIFVVASIGMACGGGLYITAIFATVVLLVALSFLGILERRLNLKTVAMMYEVQGGQADEIISAVNGVLEKDRKVMQTVNIARSNGHFRVQFTLVAKHNEHQRLLAQLKSMPQAHEVVCLGETDHE
jgi:putative Mg2+ transporter-C (MgtC) family protein